MTHDDTRPRWLPAAAPPVWRLAVLAGLTVWCCLRPSESLLAAEWPDEYRTGQLICHADFSLTPYRNLLNSLPQLDQELTAALGIPGTSEPIHLLLFERKNTYQAYVKQYFPDVPSRKALFIKGRGPGMVFAHLGENFENDLRHECTHAFLNGKLPMVPLWLDEGLAVYFEVPDERRAFGNPHLSSVKWSARMGQVPRLEVLEGLRDLNEMGRARYRQAWSWVHFMLLGPPEARLELQRYLADIQALTPPGQLHQRLRQRLPNLEQQFLEHFRNWKS